MNDVVTWAALGGAIAAVIAIIKGWNFITDKINRARQVAENATAAAAEARKEVGELKTAISIMTGAMQLHREQVARDYITRDVMGQVETRLTTAIERVGDRMDNVVKAVLEAATLRSAKN